MTGLGDEQLKVSGGAVDPVVELLVVGEDLDPGGTVECDLAFHRGQGPAVIGDTEMGASAGTGDGNFKRPGRAGEQIDSEPRRLRAQGRGRGVEGDSGAADHCVESRVSQDHAVSGHLRRMDLAAAFPGLAAHLEDVTEVRREMVFQANRERRIMVVDHR